MNSFGELLEPPSGKKAELSFNLRRRLPMVRVDPSHLEMALLNIVVNARDASPTGGAITVATRELRLSGDAARHLEPGDFVVLSVTDEGTGMPAHIRARNRTVLYDKGGRSGHGPRSGYGSWLCPAIRRPVGDRQRAWAWYDRADDFSEDVPRKGRSRHVSNATWLPKPPSGSDRATADSGGG